MQTPLGRGALRNMVEDLHPTSVGNQQFFERVADKGVAKSIIDLSGSQKNRSAMGDFVPRLDMIYCFLHEMRKKSCLQNTSQKTDLRGLAASRKG